jgi:hypothetical protein
MIERIPKKNDKGEKENGKDAESEVATWTAIFAGVKGDGYRGAE